MVVVEHQAVGLQVKLIIVKSVLAKAHTGVFVDDASHFDDLPALETKLILVSDDLCVVVVALRDQQLVVRHALDSADEGDRSPDKAI